MANPPPRIRRAILVGIALVALALRLPSLGERPMHTDEAVNGYITGHLLQGESYAYDPEDRHGPALYALAVPVAWLSGARNFADLTEATVRLGPAIVGALTILLFGMLAGQIGFLPSLAASLLFALGPLSVYYNRYFIHETLFVVATLSFLLTGWRALFSRSMVWGALAGASAGLMLACKETAVLHYAAVGVTAVWLWFNIRKRKGKESRAPALVHRTGEGERPGSLGDLSQSEQGTGASGKRGWWPMIISACVVFMIVVTGLYTWGGRHWRGPLDLLRAIPQFTARAGGQGHEKPASYYLALTGGTWPGGLVVGLAIAGGIVAASRRIRAAGLKEEPGKSTLIPALSHPMGEWVTKRDSQGLAEGVWLVYGISVALIYSLIPYKTPWLALDLWLPISVLAGIGAVALFRFLPTVGGRWFLGFAGVTLLAALASDSWFWSVSRPADERNPYAYAHTSEDLLGLPDRLRELVGDKNDSRIAVVAADPWPLPWYLRQFPQTGYWQPGSDPGPADVYITSLESAEEIQSRTVGWRPEFFGLRSEVLVILWSQTSPAGAAGKEDGESEDGK